MSAASDEHEDFLRAGMRHYGDTKTAVVDFETEIEDAVVAALSRKKRLLADAFGVAKRTIDVDGKRTGRGHRRFRVDRMIAAACTIRSTKVTAGFRFFRTGKDHSGPWSTEGFVLLRFKKSMRDEAKAWVSMHASTVAWSDDGEWRTAFRISPESMTLAGAVAELEARLDETIDLLARFGDDA